MTNRKPKDGIKNKATPRKSSQRLIATKGTAANGNKVIVNPGDKSAQVLAATVGGAVIGNLIAPGIGGALFGGVIGALLGNGSNDKGSK